MIPAIFDHTALLALGAGYPALCLTTAEARPGVAEIVGALPGLDIDAPDLSAAIAVGALIGDGIDWRIAHAVHASPKTPEASPL
ncbi:hypothetical protein [Streptacidiphilus sp. PAMC 29251]